MTTHECYRELRRRGVRAAVAWAFITTTIGFAAALGRGEVPPQAGLDWLADVLTRDAG